MKKKVWLLTAIVFMALTACETEKEEIVDDSRNCYTGKLVKKGICMNYVIEVLDTNFDINLVETSWRDNFSDISYNNVFTLGSVCDFPTEIDEGATFDFLVLNEYDQECPVCLAYTPTPDKSLYISVCKKPLD